jgi:hypothetical protein
MLCTTGITIMARRQVNITQHSMRIEQRFGLDFCKRFVAMVEAARAFMLTALLIN